MGDEATAALEAEALRIAETWLTPTEDGRYPVLFEPLARAIVEAARKFADEEAKAAPNFTSKDIAVRLCGILERARDLSPDALQILYGYLRDYSDANDGEDGRRLPVSKAASIAVEHLTGAQGSYFDDSGSIGTDTCDDAVDLLHQLYLYKRDIEKLAEGTIARDLDVITRALVKARAGAGR